MTQKTQIDHVVQMTADVGGLKITDMEFFSDHESAARFAEKMADYGRMIEVCGEWMLFSQEISVFSTEINLREVQDDTQEL